MYSYTNKCKSFVKYINSAFPLIKNLFSNTETISYNDFDYQAAHKENIDDFSVQIFDCAHKAMDSGNDDGIHHYNTRRGEQFIPIVNLGIQTLVSSIPLNELPISSFDFFIVVDLDGNFYNGDYENKDWLHRGKEIHMPNYPPTELAEQSLFGQDNDGSIPNAGIYYVTKKGLPWIVNVPFYFDYLYEKEDIAETYKELGEWVQTGGENKKNWYKNTGSNVISDNVITIH